MNQQIVTIIAFVSISFIAIALLMLIRELLGNGRQMIFRRLGWEDSRGRTILQEERVETGDWGVTRWLRRLFLLAGLFRKDSAAGLWLIGGTLVLVGGFTFVLLENAIVAIGAAAFAFVIIVVALLWAGYRRLNMIREQLPNAMEMLARGLRAGESVDQAVALVAKSCPAPINAEFRRCARQLEMGLSLSTSMEGIVRRVPMMEMRILASSISLQKRAGGSLARTLDRLARVFRERLQFYRRYRTVTAASRLSIFVISLAAPSVFLYLFIWQGEYMEPLVSTTNGLRLLALDVALLVVGLAWSFRLLRAE